MDSNIHRISFTMSDDDRKAVNDAIQVLRDKLLPQLISLSTGDRRSLHKMGDAAMPFVTKATNYAANDPKCPTFLDVAEMQHDLDVVEILNGFARTLNVINSNLDDSIMAAGSEVYASALVYYQAVKAAARARVSGAQAIADDLAASIPVHSGPRKATPTAGTAN